MSELMYEAGRVVGEYDVLASDCVLISNMDVCAFIVRGEDRRAWLQGQATNDMRTLATGGSLAFCLCKATGQIEAVCRIWELADEYLLLTHGLYAPAVEERFRTGVILEDVSAERLETARTFSLQGPGASAELSKHSHLPQLDCGRITLAGFEEAGAIALRSDRTGYGGWDLVLPSGGLSELFSSIPVLLSGALAAAELEAGIPRPGVDITPQTLPPELGGAFLAEHVSYSKGCYTGQEVLMRIHSRGHTNRTWVGLEAESEMSPGAEVTFEGRVLGNVTRAAASPRLGPIGAAIVRNEAAASGTRVQVDGRHCRVVRMPMAENGDLSES